MAKIELETDEMGIISSTMVRWEVPMDIRESAIQALPPMPYRLKSEPIIIRDPNLPTSELRLFWNRILMSLQIYM